jgi:hypothetical protein
LKGEGVFWIGLDRKKKTTRPLEYSTRHDKDALTPFRY